MVEFKMIVRAALLAERDRRRSPGVSWGRACCWVPVEDIAAACGCDVNAALTALNKLAFEGLCALSEPASWLVEPTHVKSLELV